MSNSVSSEYSSFFVGSGIDDASSVESASVAPLRRKRLTKRQAKFCLMTACAIVGALFLSDEGRANPYFSMRRKLAYDTSEQELLPTYTENYANIWDPVEPAHQPFFWYIPKAGGSTLQKIFGQCIDLVSCSACGKDTGESEVTPHEHTYEGISLGKFLNANPSTELGIDKVKDLGIVESGQADVYITHHLVYSSELFNNNNKARMFTMLRQPTKRIIDQFYYRQRATWADDYDYDLASMSLEQYVASDKYVENFVVRSLTNHYETNVTQVEVDLAKEILRRKFLVGLIEWYDLSVLRFEKYFGWYETKNVGTNHTVNYCHHRKIADGDHIGNHPLFDSGEEVYTKISVRNWADIELYVYAKKLFADQEQLIEVGTATA